MSILRSALACLLLAAATALLAVLALGIHRATPRALAALANLEQASERIAALIGETATGEPVTIARLVETADGTLVLVRPVLRETAATVKGARQPLQEAAETIRAARPVLGAAERAIDRTEPLLAAATGTIERAGKSAEALALNLNASWDELFWDVKASVESGTMAARGIAEAADAAGKAAPAFIATWDRIGKNSDRATESTARVMGNFAEATKPLPKWMRLGLAVAPPMVQVGASVITTMAITGK